jgi:PAS domain S-box-containing protein
MPATMTLDDATKEIERLKAQVVALEHLLETHEQIVADQSDRLHEMIQERERQTESLRHRLAFENLLAHISAEFINVPLAEIDRGCNRALRLIGEFVQADRSYLFQVRIHGATMDNTHEWCAPGISSQIERLQQLPTAAFPWFMDRFHRHEVLCLPRVADLPPEAEAERQELRAQDIQSLLCVPIVLRHELLGFVGFDSVRAERIWSEDTIILLRLVGTIFANALDRARAENTLRKSEEHFRALIEHSLDIATILDPDGTVRYHSPSLQRVLGWHPSDRVGRSAFELLHPDDGPHAREVLRNVLGNPGAIHSMECRFRHQDGSWRALESFGTMTQDPRGNPCIMINSRDVTERRQAKEALGRSQAQFAAFMRYLPGIAFMKDSDGRHIFVNEAFETLFNLSRAEWEGKTNDDLFPPDIAATFTEHDRLVMRGSIAVHTIETTALSDGRHTWLVAKFPVRLDNHTSPLLGGVAIDVTERTRAVDLLEAEKRILEAIAQGNSLADVLDLVARQVETLTEGMQCSILLADDDGLHLRHGVAPSLPDSYNRLVDGLAIGPSVGSCGTAAHRKERVIVSDIATDPLWKDYRAIARQYGLGACWSTPIMSASGALLGTFALYYGSPRQPMPSELSLIERVTHLVQIAIERHRSESALARLTRRLELIVTSAGEGIFGLDLDGRVTFANPAVAKMLGWRAEDMIGRPAHAQWHHTHADGTPYPVEECPIYAAFMDGRTHVHNDDVFWRKDGTSLPVDYVSAPLLDKGDIIGSVVVCHDITARKQAEEELHRTQAFLQSVVENIPHMILVKETKELRFVSVNKAGEEFLGIPRTDMIGKTVYDLFPEAQADALFAGDLDVLSARGARTLPDQVIETMSRGPRVFHIRKIAIPGPDQRPAYILSIAEDITERKQAAEALVQRETDLRKALEERERIGQDLHDGILQSLYAVGLGLEACKPLLHRERRKKTTATLTSALEQAIVQLNQVMREVRNFIAGLESDLLRGRDLPAALRSLAGSLQSASTRIRLAVDDRATQILSTDHALHILYVAKEALSNSLRHSHPRQIVISLKRLKQSVRLTVHDDGVGFRPDRTRGVGHGLANMAARADKIGGRLAIRSKPNHGTWVIFDLPKEAPVARV